MNSEPADQQTALHWDPIPLAEIEAARLLFMKRRIPQICLYAPVNIAEVTGAQRSVLGWIESLTGLHLGKCVLITGGYTPELDVSAMAWLVQSD